MGRRFMAVAAALMIVLLCSCAGGGFESATPAAEIPAAPIVLPPFPTGGADAGTLSAPRVAAFTDYIALGKDTYSRSPSGAVDNGSALDLTSTTADFAWGMWRWPGFIAGINPEEIEVTVTPGAGGTFWLLLADYTHRRWEIHGPLDGGITTFTFDPAIDYISSGGNAAYAVLLVEGGNTLEADQLRLSATDLPALANLSSDAGSNTATLSWDAITDPEALGYQLYTGPVVDFNIGDPGVEQRGGMITNPYYEVTGLTGETHYYWRVRAYFGAWGPLSATAEFTTLPSQAPVPAITVETYLQQNVEAIFGPFNTTDADTPLSELTFKWDFENDGTDDITTTGPEYVYHTYTERGPFTVKLTVFDGQNVSVTADVKVGFHYRFEATASPQGDNAEVLVCDADEESGRAVMLLTSRIVRYFDGSSWQSIDASTIGEESYCDVALNPTSFSIITASTATPPSWKIFDYAAGGFTQNGGETAGGNVFSNAMLDIAPNGRRSVELVGGSAAGMSFTGTLYVWHEKADSTFSSNNVTLDSNKFQAYDVVRSDADSYFLYTKATSTHIWSFSDGGNSDTTSQSYSSDASSVALSLDPENPTHVFWATQNGATSIYYGDNYGTANPAGQFYASPGGTTKVIAAGLAGDNEGHFFWTATDASEVQHLYGYDTVAGGGTLYEIVVGPGAAFKGAGAYYPATSDTGVYTAVVEPRDGEVTARIIENGVVQSETQAAGPTGGGTVTDTAAVVAYADNSFLCLAQQDFPTALSTSASGPDAAFVPGLLGVDTWCNPNCAAVDPLGGGFFVGSYTDSGRLLLNRFDTGNTTGTVTANISGTTMARLAVNRDMSDIRLFSLVNSGQDIVARSWDGADWSSPASVYDGAATIEAYSVAVTADNTEWGIAFLDTDEAVKLVETTGGTWGSADTLSTDSVFGACGLGFDYCLGDASQGLMVAVERDGAETGVFAGTRPEGGSITWELVASPTVLEAQSLTVFWHMDNPVVVLRHAATPAQDDRLWFFEKLPSEWFFTEPYMELHSNPLAKAVLPSGHMIFTGFELTSYPRQMITAVFYP